MRLFSWSTELAIKLDAPLETSLVMAIADGLQSTVLTRGYLYQSDLAWAITVQNEMPKEVQEKIERWLGVGGLTSLVLGELQRDRNRQPEKEELPVGRPLTSLSFIGNPNEYARNIVAKLKGLPYRYRLTAALPEFFSNP